MPIDLSHFERGDKFDGAYSEALEELQHRLYRAQVAHIVHGRSAIILFEGWDAAGKGGIIRRMTAEWDPRYYQVWPIGAPTDAERDRHFLWRFWQRLPAKSNIAVFDRSWYGRVLVERVEGFATDAQWKRAYDEINEFEAQQKDAGTTVVKLFVHVTQKEQDERLRARLEDPWKRWKTGPDDYRNRARRADYLKAIGDMFKHSDTRWAPWIAIDGNSKKAARIEALTRIVERLEKAVPMDPPEIDAELERVAREALGE